MEFKWVMVKTYNDLYKAMKIFKDFNISDVKLIDPNVNGKMKLSGYFIMVSVLISSFEKVVIKYG